MTGQRRPDRLVLFAVALPQAAVGQDVALQEGVEHALDEPGQLSAGAGLGVSDEAGRVLLHQAIQGRLLWPMAVVVDRGTVGRPLVLPADDLLDGLPVRYACAVSSRAQRLNRPECRLPQLDRCSGTSFGAPARIRPTASRRPIRGPGCRLGVGSVSMRSKAAVVRSMRGSAWCVAAD